jgi:hypothetical protein
MGQRFPPHSLVPLDVRPGRAWRTLPAVRHRENRRVSACASHGKRSRVCPGVCRHCTRGPVLRRRVSPTYSQWTAPLLSEGGTVRHETRFASGKRGVRQWISHIALRPLACAAAACCGYEGTAPASTTRRRNGATRGSALQWDIMAGDDRRPSAWVLRPRLSAPAWALSARWWRHQRPPVAVEVRTHKKRAQTNSPQEIVRVRLLAAGLHIVSDRS